MNLLSANKCCKEKMPNKFEFLERSFNACGYVILMVSSSECYISTSELGSDETFYNNALHDKSREAYIGQVYCTMLSIRLHAQSPHFCSALVGSKNQANRLCLLWQQCNVVHSIYKLTYYIGRVIKSKTQDDTDVDLHCQGKQDRVTLLWF